MSLKSSKRLLYRILTNIWIGNISTSQNNAILTKRNIEFILTIHNNQDNNLFEHQNQLILNLNDGDKFPPDIINQGVQFINTAIKSGKGVLINCINGESLSPSMIAAYLMKELGYNPEKAFDILKTRRNFVNPDATTYNSVVDWAWPSTTFFCTRCNKSWVYEQKMSKWEPNKYNLKGFTENKSESKVKSLTCSCRKPIVVLKS